MKIIALVATDEDMGIGKDGSIPWKCLQDLKRVKQLRQGQHIVMGRKTWEGFPEQMQDRMIDESVVHVMSKSVNLLGKQAYLWSDKANLLYWLNHELPTPPQRIFIFGGAEIYRLFWEHITHIYISTIEGQYDCDAFFPAFHEDRADRLVKCTYDFDVTVHDDIVWVGGNEAFFPKKSEKGVNHLFAVWRRNL